MVWAAIGAAGVGLVGGAMASRSASKSAQVQSDAAKQAAADQLQASREANQLTAEMYRSGLRQQAPYQQGGQLALSQLMQGMGLGAARSSVAPGAGGMPQKSNMPMAPAGTYTNAAGKPTDAQGNEITPALNYGIGDINYGATQEELDAAAAGIDPGYFNRAFTAADLMAGIDPGYQFRIDQGNAALNARRAATGNRFGGQALKDITAYNQDAASQEYGNAYQRYMGNKALIYDRLSGLAGVGQSAGNAATAAGTAAGGTIGANTMAGARGASDYLTSGAAARGAGMVGSTNAIVGGINSGLNNWYTSNIMNRFMPQTPYTPQYGQGGNMPDYNSGTGPY